MSRLVTLEGYDFNELDGFSLKKIGKSLKKVAKSASKIAKSALKVAKVVGPVMGASMGIPPSMTNTALNVAGQIAKGKINTKSLLKTVAGATGVNPNTLAVMGNLVGKNAKQRAVAVKKLAKKNPILGKTAQKLADDMLHAETVIAKKVVASEVEKNHEIVSEVNNDTPMQILYKQGAL